MARNIEILVLFTAMFATSCMSNYSEASYWEKFLADPNEQNYNRLSKAIDPKDCGWGNSNNLRVFPDYDRQKVFNLISNGNDFAFVISLKSIRCLDGGDLHDFYQSAGMFFDLKPNLFIKYCYESSVLESDLVYMLTMLPGSTVDNMDLQLNLLNERQSKLAKYQNDRASNLVSIGIKSLEDLKKMILGGQQ